MTIFDDLKPLSSRTVEKGSTAWVRPQHWIPKALWNQKGTVIEVDRKRGFFYVELKDYDDDIYVFTRIEIYLASEY